jgi:hypothetical protein
MPFIQKVYHLNFCYDEHMSEVFGSVIAAPEMIKKPAESRDKRVTQPMFRRLKRALGNFFLVAGLSALLAFGAHANEPNPNHQEYAYVDYEPDMEDGGVEEIIENLQEIRAGNEDASTRPVEIMLIGNSIFTESTGIFSDGTYSDISITNLSARSAYFGQYGDPDNPGGFVNQQGILDFIDRRESNPTFVLFQLGSNEAQYINFEDEDGDGIDEDVYSLLETYNEDTGRVTDNGRFTSQWLNEMLSMIDELKSRGIIPIMGGGPRVRGVASSFQMNTIFVEVARLKGIPFIDATSSAEMTSAMYGFTYGSEILVDSVQSADGIHFEDISDLTPFLVEALQDIEERTRPDQNHDNRGDNDTRPPDITHILDQDHGNNDDNDRPNLDDIRNPLDDGRGHINWPRGNN